MIDIKLLSELCNAPGVPGFENPIRELVRSTIQPFVDDCRIDAMGNLIVHKKGGGDKSLMIAAHMDEIGFIVSHIDDDGFIRFQPLGGFDPKTLTAQRVLIHGKKDILGVMGSKPVHLMTADEKTKPLQLKDYFIDTGMSAKEVKDVVTIGDAITRERELVTMGSCINAKSLDNRISVYILIEALRELAEEHVPYDVFGVFSVQEEVGLRGAKTAASSINPHFGINLDVTVAFDLPGAQPQERVSQLGKGTAIKILDGTVICDQRMVRFMKKYADKYDIDWQAEVLPAGGTDAGMIQRGGKDGAIVGGISIPCRNLHQVIEMVDKNDVRASIDLLKVCIKKMDKFDPSF